ncbi:hypothetical protein TR80_008365 [Xanthomonas campestris]|nr:hypothetical protein TR80_008365 [Xanthomonas campestris]
MVDTRGAASGSGTRRESVHGGSVAASMPPHGPAPGRDAALPSRAMADRTASIFSSERRYPNSAVY